MHAMLTTTVANYVVKPEQYAQVRKAAYGLDDEAHFLLTNNNGECIQSIGNRELVPAIWTHTPVPMGLSILALKKQFEERALHVLGDWDSVPSFDVHSPERAGLYTDNRYVHVGIRGAWMMYVDQAIEHFNSK